MANYYFLAPSLPPLAIGESIDIDFEELTSRFEMNLTPKDLSKTEVIRRYIDLKNIATILRDKEIDTRGNLSEKELDQALLTLSEFPDYVIDYLQQYESTEERLNNFSSLIASYFTEEMKGESGFIPKYLAFERSTRLVLLALRCKRYQRDVLAEMQFEDFSDPLVAHILAHKDEKEYEPPAEFAELKEIFVHQQIDPLRRYQAFLEYKFYKIEEMIERPLFSIEWILAYLIEYIFVDQWNKLDEDEGEKHLERIAVV